MIDCASIILPMTPPVELVATMRTSFRFSCCAVMRWRLPKRALDAVSEPVRNTPSQPRYAAKKGYAAPADVNASPSTASVPEYRVRNPRPSSWPMTRTGTFIRRAVRDIASRHCAADSLRYSPDRSAATKTPVPAADSQLIVNLAASGFASGLTTGGVRWTLLWRSGISHAGSDSVPLNGDPS